MIGPIILCALVAIAVIAAWFGFHRPTTRRIDGFWHENRPADARWTPWMWHVACQQSMEQSRARR